MNSSAQVFESDSPNKAATVSIMYQQITTIATDSITPTFLNLLPLEKIILSIAIGIARKIATTTETATA